MSDMNLCGTLTWKDWMPIIEYLTDNHALTSEFYSKLMENTFDATTTQEYGDSDTIDITELM